MFLPGVCAVVIHRKKITFSACSAQNRIENVKREMHSNYTNLWIWTVPCMDHPRPKLIKPQTKFLTGRFLGSLSPEHHITELLAAAQWTGWSLYFFLILFLLPTCSHIIIYSTAYLSIVISQPTILFLAYIGINI